MRIVVTSDSHGNTNAVSQLIQSDSFGLVVFCGDGVDDFDDIKDDPRLVRVSGNCDYFSTCQDEAVLNVFGKKIFVTHGNKYFVKVTMSKLLKKAKEMQADIVLYGHTHRQKSEQIDGIYFVNPGALENGKYAILDIDESGKVNVSMHRENI